jgi:hypothetical protein
MAGGTIWKGSIHFGDTDVPVKLHAAIKEERIQFHLLHRRDQVKLHQQMICAYEKIPVPTDAQTKGFEVEDGKYILVDPAELEQTVPESSRTIELSRLIGAHSREASRVEVPFSFIAPTQEEIWKSDSRRGISVPLGRAGAVRKLSLRLGQGTSQHVLVAGKTGSGKSTLWHALIVNLAMRYSTDEIEMYLSDFKKGVEFKLYAECRLPHARVIAIESEREFGLSVLQWLDAELRNRGDRFRSAGVNDLASYRELAPGLFLAV